MTISIEDRELVSILEALQNNDFTGHKNSTETSRLKGYFYSETVFNLSKKALTEAEIKVLEKGLHYAIIQNKVIESELRSDFEEFCRIMHLKGYFPNTLLLILAISHHLHQNRHENLQQDTIILRFFEVNWRNKFSK